MPILLHVCTHHRLSLSPSFTCAPALPACLCAHPSHLQLQLSCRPGSASKHGQRLVHRVREISPAVHRRIHYMAPRDSGARLYFCKTPLNLKIFAGLFRTHAAESEHIVCEYVAFYCIRLFRPGGGISFAASAHKLTSHLPLTGRAYRAQSSRAAPTNKCDDYTPRRGGRRVPA